MEVNVKEIVGFKASIEAVGASTTIKAVVSVENGKYANIENGSVSDNDGDKELLATFAHYGGLNINYQTTDEDEIVAVVTDVTRFVKYCKANADKLGKVSDTDGKVKGK